MNLHPQRRYFLLVSLPALILMLFVTGTNQKVLAQSSNNVVLAARAGFGGNCKTNRWVPIQIRAENKGAEDLEARVQVSYTNNLGGETAYGTALSLPGNSRKEFFLYLYYDGYLNKPQVSLTVKDQVLVENPLPLNCLDPESLIIGLITDTPNAFNGLSSLTAPNGYTRITRLKLEDLPDHPEGWDALDALVIAGVDTGALSEQQRNALTGWLAQGGKLLVTGGPKWQEIANGLGTLLPLNLNNTQAVDNLSSLQTYLNTPDALETRSTILAVGQVRAKAIVLVSQGNIPVLAKSQVGFGTVYYLAADPGLEPLSTWKSKDALYQSILQSTTPHATWMKSTINTYTANQALAALPALGLPPAMFVFCLLGVYILIVGPVNYVILRLIKRQELAWITIPGFVILFTLVAYISGFWIRGTRPILNRLTIVQAWDDVEQAQARTLVGIYSPGRTQYTLQAGPSFLPSPFDSGTQALQTNKGWLSLQKGTDTLLPDVIVEAGGMKSAMFQGSIPALAFTHNLTLSMSSSGPIMEGTITNASQYTLKDITLITSGNKRSLGTMGPGATAQISLPMNNKYGETQIFDLKNNPAYSYYSGTDDVNEERVRQVAFMNAVLSDTQSYTAAGGNVSSGIYLTGWLDKAVVPMSVQGLGFDSIDTTYYILSLTPAIRTDKANELRLTPGFFNWSSSSPNTAPYSTADYYAGSAPDQYTLTFKLTAPVRYTAVKSLALVLSVSTYYRSSNQSFDTTNTAALWDWQKSAWVQIPNLVWGTNAIADPANYVGPEGEIRLKINRINAQNQDANPVASSYFTMVVQP